jgi:hypothetical protein
MNLGELQQLLADTSVSRIEIHAAGTVTAGTVTAGTVTAAAPTVAPHFHITEVGLVSKRFIDCGGVAREDRACVLQTLVAHDTDHRLTPQKLAGIFAKSWALGLEPTLPVDVEIQGRSIETWRISGVEAQPAVLLIRVSPKQTACLAEDLCGLSILPLDAGCGGGSSGCC